ncbi:methyl-accepting chemotaxis protein [Caulobacter mirabilis]|uniref:Chemotaxis protein n=1 Tax=Caulobacter mirabilis TaxID=69666 RepID=A0A2D2B020_9CAUL|nr:PAS domain-containing methyl-accepting chemotaxis protein [Caulobacter mirabilis]ATQ43602.1 chemotaxis protein [Caulobacter mirabilis]
MIRFGGARSQSASVDGQRVKDLEAQVAAMDRSQAVIEFQLDGTVIKANGNFLQTLGYSLDEIVGRHHSMFCPPDYAASQDYRDFWRQLNNGEFFANKYLRHGKGGREIWIQATYNPVMDETGRPYKVIKFASDITAVELERIENDARRGSEEEQKAVVSHLADGLGRLAKGDLTAEIVVDFAGGYQQLKLDFNAAVQSLRTAMASISDATTGIDAGSNEIAGAADDLSKRTEQQAARLEETAAALDEITATVKRSASGAQQAAQVVNTAREDAERSGEVVRDAVSAMGSIENSSKEISQIIGVIDEIAFQTNLLALNAGVEAARAGDAGRGFAVVASEVRALAQRSAEAAKEIKTLISASTQQVGQGVQLVGKTGEALVAIVNKVAEIQGLVGEISASAQEQATALADINETVNQMDQMTQQNAAMVEESTAAARSLMSEANQLSELVAGFQVGEATAPRVQRARPAPVAAVRPVAATQRASAPAENPVHRARAKVAAYANGGSAAAAVNEWEEF